MKKLIIILLLTVGSICYAGSPESPYYLQFVSVTYKEYIGKHIFVDMGTVNIYHGTCLAISDASITIKDISGPNIKILTIPMNQIKKYWRETK
jgi:hypothetical protein